MSTIVLKTREGITRISTLAKIELEKLMAERATITGDDKEPWWYSNAVKIKTLEMLSSVMMGYADEIHIELKDLRYLL